jgi:homopolymeric O-antigen transport system permease protein
MAVASGNTSETVPRLHLPHRPAWLLSIVLDATLGIGAYLTAYWLRFQGDRLVAFLPGAWSTMPFVVGGQLAALCIVRAYGRRSRLDWLGRVVAGIVVGTAISSILLGLTAGFEGVSRSAFVADAVLFSIAAVAWRGLWVLRARALTRAAAAAARADDLVDRTETMTLRGVVASLYHYRGLLKNLVLKDLKLKYRGSVFGFMWSLLNPLLMIVVYTVAFTFILRIRTAGFVFYLMLGQLAWAFFANSASMSTGAIVDNAGLLKSVLFPRAILPIGTVLFNLAQYLLTMLVFLPAMMVWYQVPLSLPMMLFPVFLVMQVAFTIGVALILASCTVFFRDVRHLLEVGLAALFWATPIVYEFRQVPEQLRLLILLGPVSPFIVAYEQLFFYRQWPDGTVWMMATANAIGAFVLGSLIFLAVEDRFTEQL